MSGIYLKVAAGAVLALSILTVGCSGGSGGGSDSDDDTVPSNVINVVVNLGDSALSIGWDEPLSNGGAVLSDYIVTIDPAVQPSDVQISGTRAIFSNLVNGTDYSVSISATNIVGTSETNVTSGLRPGAPDNASYTNLVISGDIGSSSGIYDPSVVQSADGSHWLSYSSIDFYADDNDDIVQDVGIRVARSTDNGDNFEYVATIATPYAGTVTDSDATLSACGTDVCDGRWVYETSWLVEDIFDEDPSRRFKLFAHKYFLYPPSTGSRTLYHLGAIVMWTASAPDDDWSSETTLLGWPRTSPDLSPLQDITMLDAALADCVLLAEGGVSLRDQALDMVFSCPYFDTQSSSFLQRIVLLRSTDNAESFQYVTTLLTPEDAPLGVDYFSAPSLIVAEDVAPVLLVTPVVNGNYAGSMIFPFAAEESEELFEDASGSPQPILFVPVQAPGHIGGASTYAREMESVGVLQSDATLGATLLDTEFNIVVTHTMVE